MTTLGMLIIWSLYRSDNGTRMPYSDGCGWSTDSGMNFSGMRHWKKLIRLSGNTDCYYHINKM